MKNTIGVLITILIIIIAISTMIFYMDKNGSTSKPQEIHKVFTDNGKATSESDNKEQNKSRANGSAAKGKMPQEKLPEPEEVLLKILGTVLDANTNEPIEGAHVFLNLQDGTKREAYTNADGLYYLQIGYNDEKTLCCRAEGFAQEKKILGDILMTSEKTIVDFLLHTGATVCGKVLDAETKEAIPDIIVRAEEPQQGGFIERIKAEKKIHGETSTLKDGTYILDFLKPGSHFITLSPQSKGYVFEREKIISLELKAGLTYDNIDFKISKGAVVEGIVKTSRGLAVPNAKINVRPAKPLETVTSGDVSREGFKELEVNTDEDGRFSISGLRYDYDYRLVASHEEYAWAASEPFVIEQGKSPFSINFVLNPGSKVSGKAIYSDGKPVENYKLMLFPDFGEIYSGTSADEKEATTDVRGKFSFEKVSKGKFTLMRAMDHEFNILEPHEDETLLLEIDGISDIGGLEFVVYLGGVINGIVLDTSNKPVPQVRVEAEQSENKIFASGTTTDNDGTFVLSQLRGESYNLSVECSEGNGYAERERIGSEVTINLAPPSSISGYVVDAKGDVAEDCNVRLVLQKKSGEIDGFLEAFAKLSGQGGDDGQKTDEKGFFEFNNVEAGTYVIKARSKIKGAGEMANIEITSGQQIADLIIKLEAGVLFSGKVYDSDGELVQGAMVSLSLDDENEMAKYMAKFVPEEMQNHDAAATTEEDGYFEMENISIGTYTLKASHSEFAATRHENLEFAPRNGITGYKIQLNRGGSVVGHALADGKPKEGLMVQLIGEQGMKMATSDKDGYFEINRIVPGTYMAQAMDMGRMMSGGISGMSPRQIIVDVFEGQTTEIDFSPPEGSVEVSGTITGELGKFTVIAIRSGDSTKPEDSEDSNPLDFGNQIEEVRNNIGSAIASPDGAFTIDGILPGKYMIRVQSIDFDFTDIQAMKEMDQTPQIEQELIVEAGKPIEISLELPAKEQ